jgi:hypothetical protein
LGFKFILTNICGIEVIPSLLLRIKQEVSSFVSMLPSKIDMQSEELLKGIDHQGTTNRLSRIDEKKSNS